MISSLVPLFFVSAAVRLVQLARAGNDSSSGTFNEIVVQIVMKTAGIKNIYVPTFGLVDGTIQTLIDKNFHLAQ